MSLSGYDALRIKLHEVPDAIRERGELLANGLQLRQPQVTNHAIAASVHGGYWYNVSVRWEDDRPRAVLYCSCPDGRDGECCKHIWALARHFVRAGILPATIMPLEDATTLISPLGPASWWRHALPAVFEQWSADDRIRPVVQPPRRRTEPDETRIVYLVDPNSESGKKQTVSVVVAAEKRRQRDGEWGAAKAISVASEGWDAAANADDRIIAQLLLGARPANEFIPITASVARPSSRFVLSDPSLGVTLRRICETLRARVRYSAEELWQPLSWSVGEPWSLDLACVREAADSEIEQWRFIGRLVHGAELGFEGENGDEMFIEDSSDHSLNTDSRGREVRALADVVVRGTYAFIGGGVETLTAGTDTRFLDYLKLAPPIVAAPHEIPALIDSLMQLPANMRVRWPAGIVIAERIGTPIPHLSIVVAPTAVGAYATASVNLQFAYGSRLLPAGGGRDRFFEHDTRTLTHRDREGESRALALLEEQGAQRTRWNAPAMPSHEVPVTRAVMLALAMNQIGWQVTLDGATLRTDVQTFVRMSSGIDWFDLDAGIEFADGQTVPLSALRAARAEGVRMMTLEDGSLLGVPFEWIDEMEPVIALGERQGKNYRFRSTQAALVDALLANAQTVDVEVMIERIRHELRSFSEVESVDPPETFVGTLRPYQRLGLGWMQLLQRCGLGGVLADDMGLGKTVQVLALLDGQRQLGNGASLLVVPNSLVFNWQREAERFTPGLRVGIHFGATREKVAPRFDDLDLVITTYGTLRRDVTKLATVYFDYIILDEAQAIKNASADVTRAVRALRGTNRLALSGTPVENHLGELWSLFEFLNPGLLGAAPAFRRLLASPATMSTAVRGPMAPDAQAIAAVAQALRPFMMRRTKAQVATDLPARTERTLYVELEGEERASYDALLRRIRNDLNETIDKVGMGKAKMQVLEALLRLRQAASHRGLTDETKLDSESAKLDALVDELQEVIEGGHKALVFSQFTSLLAIVKRRLDAVGIVYEYLDGKTRDREARVDRFQNDTECPVFLISLKAGGTGLNLTAAEYVFLLDPWWNPATEAQAIDRAHRIGQSRHVIATRLVAKDTVEERILELQAGKRALADAILGGEAGPMAGLGREELEQLLR